MFPKATPTVNVSESEAHAAEDILTASAEENEEEVRVPTPPAIEEEAVPDVNVPVPDPPVHQEEVENIKAATTNDNEADDVVMADANVAPEVNVVPEVIAPEANDAPDANLQPEVTAAATATAPVPPPRPHTIEQAYNYGQLVTVRWPILVPPPAAGSQFDYHVEHSRRGSPTKLSSTSGVS